MAPISRRARVIVVRDDRAFLLQVLAGSSVETPSGRWAAATRAAAAPVLAPNRPPRQG